MHRRISEDMKEYSDRHFYGVESITNSCSLLKDLQLLWDSSVPEICFLHLFFGTYTHSEQPNMKTCPLKSVLLR